MGKNATYVTLIPAQLSIKATRFMLAPCHVKTPAKNLFVILSEAKNLVFMRFFGRFAPSE